MSGGNEATVGSAYSAWAGEYIERFASADRVHADDLAFIARHLEDCQGAVVDAGCGPGHLTAYLHALGVDVRGIDLVPEFIAHARSNHPGIGFEQSSYATLDASPTPLSGVLAWYSLIHLPPDAVAESLRVFRRATEAGGMLLLGLFTEAQNEPFDHTVTTAYFWPIGSIGRLLADTGYQIVATETRPNEGRRLRTHLAIAARAV